MNVDFDCLRKNLIVAYNDLVEKLNQRQAESDVQEIELDLADIAKEIDELRGGIATLGMLYEESMGIKSLKDMTLLRLETGEDF